MMIKVVHFFNFSGPKNNLIANFLITGHSVQICLADKKQDGPLVIKV